MLTQETINAINFIHAFTKPDVTCKIFPLDNETKSCNVKIADQPFATMNVTYKQIDVIIKTLQMMTAVTEAFKARVFPEQLKEG